MAEVKMLDAGSHFGPGFVGTEVPTFEEALGAALGRGPLLVDMKDGVIGSQVAAGLVNVGATASDIVLWTTTTAEVIEAQTFLPGSRIFFQTNSPSEALMQSAASLGVDGVSIFPPPLTPSLVALGHSLGLDVYVYGANGRATIATALFYGVDGIHHADPQFVLDFLSEDDCSDNADYDQDGFVDFPYDPDCASPTDTSELSTVACDDGIDNDGDGFVDFPDDPGCFSPLDSTEQFSLVPLLSPAGWILLAFSLVVVSLPSVRYFGRKA